MKVSRLRILVPVLLLAVLFGCSTKKNTSMSRFYHAMTARFNIYFNGEEAYKDGVKVPGMVPSLLSILRQLMVRKLKF